MLLREHLNVASWLLVDIRVSSGLRLLRPQNWTSPGKSEYVRF